MSSEAASVTSNSILSGRWKLGSVVGAGACGKVYNATLVAKTGGSQVNPDYEVVAKVIPMGVGKGKQRKEQERLANTLNYEYMMYTGVLIGFPYAPRLPDKFYGTDLGVRYLVMEKLEEDLVGFAKGQPKPQISQIADIGQQLLTGLEWIHKKSFLFVDIKPQNFMLKHGKVYFVDCKFRSYRSCMYIVTPAIRRFDGAMGFI